MKVRRRSAVWLAAVLALLVGMALLPSAGAAESASERLGADGTREFAGADRYETAVLLAEAVVDARSVSSAIVASGESLVDATAAASLAAVQSSVVLLTRPDVLPASVAAFIETAGLSAITIVGGPAAVSPGVETQLGALSAVSTVSRVSGADRYATSAAIAAQSEVPGAFCGIERSVFLVGGSSLVDAIAAGPYAYAMGMPILFTEADGLPTVVSSYLRDADIQRAVVVGDVDAVSTAVDGQLREAGIVHPWRIDGPDAPTRAVDLLKAVATCSETTISPDTVALVDAIVPIDGTTAAAALGTGLGVPNTVIPALVVGETLPAVVRHYLAPNPPSGDPPAYERVNLLPLGGTARLTPALLTETIKAATTELPPTVTFTRYFHYPPAAHLEASCINDSENYLATFSVPPNPKDALEIRNYTYSEWDFGTQAHRRTDRLVLHGDVDQLSDRVFLLSRLGLPPTTVPTFGYNTTAAAGRGHDWVGWGGSGLSQREWTLGLRPNGIRTASGQVFSHETITEFERRPNIEQAGSPTVYATTTYEGRQLNVFVFGGTNKHVGHAGKDDNLRVEEISVNLGGVSYRMDDRELFGYDGRLHDPGGCEGADGGEIESTTIKADLDLRFSVGDTITVEAGAIRNRRGVANPELTVPIERRADFPTHPWAHGREIYLPESRPSSVLTEHVSITPFLNYPPLWSHGSYRCVNRSNAYLVDFNEPVNLTDASVKSSYVFAPSPDPSYVLDFYPISRTAVEARFWIGWGVVDDPERIRVRDNAIRMLDGRTARSELIVVERYGQMGNPDVPLGIYAFTDHEGVYLKLLWVGSDPTSSPHSIDRHIKEPTWATERRSSATSAVPTWWFRTARCWSNDGSGALTLVPGIDGERFSAGQELIFGAGALTDRDGNPSPEMTVIVESFEELQANAPNPLALSQ